MGVVHCTVGARDAHRARAGHIVLTDDFAPGQSLLAAVVEARAP